MLQAYPFHLFANPRSRLPGPVVLPDGGYARARAEITSWPGYAPTPLRDLPGLAAEAGVAAVRLKDEAERFGLGSFKALGGAYAVAEVLIAELARRGVAPAATSADLVARRYAATTRDVTVTTATDGNHGRSVAWGAERFGCRCVIYIHRTVSVGREQAIARYGAEVRRVAGNYDDAVHEAARTAAAQGWFVVSDTSWPGYESVPVNVMQGYRLMIDEVAEQWAAPPTHVFIQAGVGAAPASVSVQARTRYAPPPAVVVVESDQAACLLASAEAGTPTAVPGELKTLMAGLACGEPSLLAWSELEHGAAAFMAVPDGAAVDCMRLLAREGIVAGESGVASLAAFLLAAADPAARETLGLGSASRVLLFNTEGATDPETYRALVG
jgi:diaminopropionate ammonia-lyase